MSLEDSFAISITPEPATMAMLTLGQTVLLRRSTWQQQTYGAKQPHRTVRLGSEDRLSQKRKG